MASPGKRKLMEVYVVWHDIDNNLCNYSTETHLFPETKSLDFVARKVIPSLLLDDI